MHSDAGDDETLSINAVSARFGVSRVTVYRAIERGHLSCRAAEVSGVVVNQIDPKEAAAWVQRLLESRLEKQGVLTKKHKLGLKRAKEINQ